MKRKFITNEDFWRQLVAGGSDQNVSVSPFELTFYLLLQGGLFLKCYHAKPAIGLLGLMQLIIFAEILKPGRKSIRPKLRLVLGVMFAIMFVFVLICE